MKPPRSYFFWYKITAPPKLPNKRGVIASYQGIAIFLTLDSHTIGISDGEQDYLGPVLTGLENDPWIFYGLTNDGVSISLYLNAAKVIEVSQRKITYKIDKFDAQIRDKDIKVIEQDLSRWVAKRESMFGQKQSTSSEYRLVSPMEQEAQLANRIHALEDMLQSYRAGKTYFFADILASLRSLVYYKTGEGSYDPLLLRIAAFKKATLPVYVSPIYDEVAHPVSPEVKATEPYLYIFGLASCEPMIPNVKMIDFQDFLEKPAILYQDTIISPLDLINKAANTQSTAHLDQRSPLVVEALKDTPIFGGQDWFQQQILSLAQLVVRIGYHVLNTR